jgi:hypothetical protein
MPRRLTLGLLTLAALSAAAAAVLAQDAPPAAGAPAPRVVGLSVAKAAEGGEFGGSLASGLLPGVGLHVQIARPGATILGVDDDASEVTSFTDDAGTDLRGEGKGFWPFAHVAEDARSCIVQFKTDLLPAPKAREIRVQGKVALLLGADPKVAEAKDVELKAGTSFDAGLGKWLVKEAAGDGEGLVVTIESKKPLDAVRTIEFVGPDGKVIPSEQRGSWSSSFNGEGEWAREIALERGAEKATVRVSWWGKVETVAVPVDVRAGVGF